MRIILSALLAFALLIGCKPDAKVEVLGVSLDAAKKVDGKKVRVDYDANKELLEILCLLPDSAMASWEWKAIERRRWVDDIKTKGFVLDTSETVMNVKTIKPHFLDYQVVDGTWKLAIYKFGPRNRLVFTDDVTGGHDINIFLFDGKQLQARPDFLQALRVALLPADAADDCAGTWAEDFPFFDFDCSRENSLLVTMPPIDRVSNDQCLIGNKVTFGISGDGFKVEKAEWLEVKASD